VIERRKSASENALPAAEISLKLYTYKQKKLTITVLATEIKMHRPEEQAIVHKQQVCCKLYQQAKLLYKLEINYVRHIISCI
jgi:hypothetical protein